MVLNQIAFTSIIAAIVVSIIRKSSRKQTSNPPPLVNKAYRNGSREREREYRFFFFLFFFLSFHSKILSVKMSFVDFRVSLCIHDLS